MPAITDVLLKPSVSSSPAVSSANTGETTSEPFADVYAAQRKPLDKAKSEPDNDQASADKAPSKENDELNASAGASEGLADNGKALPSEGEQQVGEPVVELLQSPLWAWVQSAQPIEPVSIPVEGLSVQVSGVQEPEIDPKVLALNSAQTSQVLIDKAVTGPVSPSVAETATSADATLDAELIETLGSQLETLGAKGAAASAESITDNNPRAAVPAMAMINAPLSAAVRATPVVPGQGLSLQPAGLSEAVVDRVMWMSSQNLKSAQIQLDPAELGRLDVRVNIQGEQTQVIFASAHASVRDALEAQMQRLRELFTQQGMVQPDVSVADRSDQDAQRSHAGSAGRGMQAEQGLDEEGPESSQAQLSQAVTGSGLVDYYA